MIKLKAYDKYNKEWVYIILGGKYHDSLAHTEQYSSNKGVVHEVVVTFQAAKGDTDSCNVSRWSDLEQVELV